jgi:glutamate formiminotransferase
MNKLIECVPNFSEGTDLALVDDIVAAVKSAKVLDVHSDPDHNRSVVTFVGEPEAVKQAAFELTERAMQLLDVNGHEGAHPFIGVVDVIPFVPVQNISEKQVVKLAHGFGQDLWQKLKLPVYFYGQAAKIEARQELPSVRRGGFYALKQEIDKPERKPDVGQGLHVTAGAVSVGVRDFLIAYNINLATRDLDIAKSIAKNIREKNGGLPGIRALGVEMSSKGNTQVTINIVDHKKTSLRQVFAEVKKWAKEYGVKVVGSELVGLLPRTAVFDGMFDYLGLNQPPRVLPQVK